MVPEGWSRRCLDQVADIRTGVAKGKTGLTNPVSLPYLRVANVQDGYLDLSEMKEIEVEAHQIERYSLRDGDIVLTEGGDFDKLGRGTIWRGQVPDCLHQNHIFAVRVTSTDLMPEFFAMQAGSTYGRDYFLSCAKRTTNLASINSTQLKQFPVLLPPFPEQQKIAEILSTWDKAIETTEALLANARTQKRALMQSLLTGTRRFPGFEGQPWREVRAGSLFKTTSIKRNGNAPLLSVTQDRGLVRRDEQERRVAMPDGGTEGYKLVVPGNFVISLRSFQGGLEYSEIEGLVSPAYHVLAAKTEIHAPFFKHYFKSYEFIGHLAIATIGIRDGRQISFDDFSFMKVPMPDISEQRRIAGAIDLAEAAEKEASVSLEALKDEKKSLMQQLLTGKRRVLV